MIKKILISSITGLFLVASSLSVSAEPNSFKGEIEGTQLLGALQLDGELFQAGLSGLRRSITTATEGISMNLTGAVASYGGDWN